MKVECLLVSEENEGVGAAQKKHSLSDFHNMDYIFFLNSKIQEFIDFLVVMINIGTLYQFALLIGIEWRRKPQREAILLGYES